jgi:hypothetical protein
MYAALKGSGCDAMLRMRGRVVRETPLFVTPSAHLARLSDRLRCSRIANLPRKQTGMTLGELHARACTYKSRLFGNRWLAQTNCRIAPDI